MPTEAYEFARFVDNEIEKLTREEFFMRTGRSKKLREEIFPLSRLALHFAQPGLKVFVESANAKRLQNRSTRRGDNLCPFIRGFATR